MPSDLSGAYTFAFASGQPQQRTFTIQATPGGQAGRRHGLRHAQHQPGQHQGISGSGTVAACWR
jgi:hypothetical protein